MRSGDSAVLQDLQLTYDPVGNAVHVHDDGISPSFFDNQQQQPDWDHTYDPLYRLMAATGRESAIDDQDPVPSWVTSGSGFGPPPPPSNAGDRRTLARGTNRKQIQAVVVACQLGALGRRHGVELVG